jgi:hypothetical protein
MKSPSDPPRLLDPPRLIESGGSAEPSVVAALEAGRSRLPDAARLGAIARALALKTTPPAGGGGQGSPRGGSLRAIKIAGSAAAGVAAVAAAWIALQSRGDVPVEQAAQQAAPAMRNLDIPSAPPASVPFAPETIPTIDIDSLPVATSHDAGAIAPPGNAHATEPPEPEVHLLARAQDALGSRPDDALRLCAEHERRFPRGAFTEEREVIAIDALVRLNRREDAKARGERFLKSHPGSADARRVRRLLRLE